jgi:CRISPR-associated protein Csd1
MLLQRLKEYADQRLDMPPVLYSEAPVRYIIELDATGRLLNPAPTDTADPANPRTRRGTRRPVPQIVRSVAITPLLLADNAEYTLGLARETSKPERVAASHEAYLALLKRCSEITREPAIEAVHHYLTHNPAAQLQLPSDFDRGATITFRVAGRFPIELPAVQNFWAAEHDPAAHSAEVMQCLVCSEERPVLNRLQGKLKGIPGGQTSGTSIISANAPAFESYGLEASLIAPTCADCGERFTKAANALLADEQSRIVLGGAIFVFWTREETSFNIRTFLADPQPAEVKNLLDSVRTGSGVRDLDDTAFYATVLSGSGGRAVVRDWIDSTLRAVGANLGHWFARQQIAGDAGEEPRPLGLYSLAAATVRELRDLPVTTPRALLRAALTGAPLPMGLLYQAVRRNRAEQKVTRQRAALIKLVLLSQRPITEETTMFELDSTNTNPAYLCGRLLAVLAEVQRNAIGKAAIVDRFFGTASSAPAAVFGRLLRGAQPHLTKLERDRPPVAAALQRRMEEVLSGLTRFPPTLTLEEQALFALGYYHQRAHDRGEARATIERRKASAALVTDQTSSDESTSVISE